MYKTLTKKQMEECLTAQQGEIDAVYMYEKLAKKVKEETDKNAFIRLAGDEARLQRVVELAGLQDVVTAHEGGLDYEIGVNGTGLSGGEQQRVAIARALMRDPKILILDEATANLDTKTEDAVKKGLASLMRGRTVIEIAHNVSAIRDADHVIVLDDGHVAASGTPAELEENNVFFRQLVREG